MLRRTSQFVTIILVIAVVAMPVMACMVPDRQMTAEEQGCCKKMAHNCESAVMPASHSCCQHPVSRQVTAASRIQRCDLGISPAALAEGVLTLSVPPTGSAISAFESPPESPPRTDSILRI